MHGYRWIQMDRLVVKCEIDIIYKWRTGPVDPYSYRPFFALFRSHTHLLSIVCPSDDRILWLSYIFSPDGTGWTHNSNWFGQKLGNSWSNGMKLDVCLTFMLEQLVISLYSYYSSIFCISGHKSVRYVFTSSEGLNLTELDTLDESNVTMGNPLQIELWMGTSSINWELSVAMASSNSH